MGIVHLFEGYTYWIYICVFFYFFLSPYFCKIKYNSSFNCMFYSKVCL